MAFEIPSSGWTQAPNGSGGGSGPHRAIPAPLDWAGLRARFVAARELRRMVDRAVPTQTSAGGSFAGEIAARLAAGYDPSPAVNPNDLGNLKAAARKDENYGGTSVPAVRGMQ